MVPSLHLERLHEVTFEGSSLFGLVLVLHHVNGLIHHALNLLALTARETSVIISGVRKPLSILRGDQVLLRVEFEQPVRDLSQQHELLPLIERPFDGRPSSFFQKLLQMVEGLNLLSLDQVN
mmetsp:Transcript_2752/g.4712  ORF Transcript_2752/g.4712 Transcript_2752/m.4712 type:complete len:122 (+) Transcript_2752:487-852(+)